MAGNHHSRPATPPPPKPAPPPPPPSPTFRHPWRQAPWGNNDKELEYVKSYKPENEDVSHIRVLLYGPVGVGKSTFINSVGSVVRGKIVTPALANATNTDCSFTVKYKTYKILRGGRGDYYPFVFNDIMGLEEGAGRGVHVDDIKLAMQGHVREGYKFNPASRLTPSDPGYNPEPSLDDRVHVLVCVYSANAGDMRGQMLQKMKEIRELASELDIPQIAVITKVDQACGEIEKNLRNTYKSKYGKRKVDEFSRKQGIPLNCIFPVRNYYKDTELDDDVTTLILSALRAIINFGEDFVNEL